MGEAIAKLMISIGFDNQNMKKSAKESEKIVSNLASKIKTTLLSFASIDVLKHVTQNFQENAIKMSNIAKKIGDNVENVDAYAKTVQRTGGNVDQFLGTLENFGTKLNKFNTQEGKEFSRSLKTFGINFKNNEGYVKTGTELMEDLANKYSSFSALKKEKMEKVLGLDETTIKLIKDGKANLKDLVAKTREYGVLTEKQAKDAIIFKKNLEELKMSFSGVANIIGSFVVDKLSILMKLFTKFIEYAKDHKELVSGMMITIAAAITTKLIPAFIKLGAAMLANPLTWIIASLVALGVIISVLYEDYQRYEKGMTNAFGQFWEELDNIIDSFKEFIKENKELIDTIYQLGVTMLKAFDNKLIERFARSLGIILITLKYVAKIVMSLFSLFGNLALFIKDTFKGMFGFLEPVFNKISSFIDKIKGIKGIFTGLSFSEKVQKIGVDKKDIDFIANKGAKYNVNTNNDNKKMNDNKTVNTKIENKIENRIEVNGVENFGKKEASELMTKVNNEMNNFVKNANYQTR